MLLLLKNLLFTIFVPGMIGVGVPLLVVPHGPMVNSILAIFGGLLLAVGASIYTWCVWDFAVVGRGTPAPIDPPKTLIVRGLYNYTRNPMYVGVLCVIAGWALLFDSWNVTLYGLCVAIGFHFFIALYEEPHLRKVFGPAYDDYCSRVPRWLPIPRSRSRMDG